MCSTRRTWCLMLVALLGIECSATGSYVWAHEVPETLVRPQESRIEPGDEITVTVRDQESLSGQVRVADDGYVVLPVLGAFQLSGQTTEAAEKAITDRLRGIVVSPQVRVVLAQRQPSAVGVLGEVRAPGQYELASGGGVLEALARAGGLTEFADDDGIFLLRRGDPPLRIRFDYRALVSGDVRGNAIKLRDGDMIVVE
jgi:polysaccharide export outer membrane protein